MGIRDRRLEFERERRVEEKERRFEETKDRPSAEKEAWSWNGNVPWKDKTKDGKGLGHWVKNQRSAYAKGTLKKDREEKLVAAGLKWSIRAPRC